MTRDTPGHGSPCVPEPKERSEAERSGARPPSGRPAPVLPSVEKTRCGRGGCLCSLPERLRAVKLVPTRQVIVEPYDGGVYLGIVRCVGFFAASYLVDCGRDGVKWFDRAEVTMIRDRKAGWLHILKPHQRVSPREVESVRVLPLCSGTDGFSEPEGCRK